MEKTLASTEQLKEVLKVIGDGGYLISELTQGFSIREIGQLLNLVNELPQAVSDASLLWPEYSSLDQAAQDDLIAFVSQTCVFPANVDVQTWIQKALDGVILLSSVIQVFKK